MSAADEFLTAWTLARTDLRALTHDEATALAAQWEADGVDNGVDPADLAGAAGGDLPAYLLRTYGEAGQKISTDGGEDHSDAQSHPPAREDDTSIGMFG